MIKHLDRINKITTSIFITLIVVMYLLAKFFNVKLSPATLLISLLVFVPMMVGTTLFTLTFLANLIRSKNSILIGFYSVITFISYKLSDIYTSKLIYESLGYRPLYVPHTASVVSIVSLILIGLYLAAFSFVILSYSSVLIVSIYNSLIRLCLFFINLKNLDRLDDKLSHLGLGSIIIAVMLFCLVGFVVNSINFSDLIRKAVIEFDYYPIRNSAYICDEAKNYEKFNYLSKNKISVYRYDASIDQPIFSIINCPTV